jgi:purine-binding chemotaxis protein CheW
VEDAFAATYRLRVLEAGDTLPVLTFDVGSTRLAIASHRVVEVSLRAEVTPMPGVPAPVTGMLRWRGEPIVVVALHHRLGLAARAPLLSDHFVIVQTVRRTLAMEVDRVRDVDAIRPAEIRGAPPSAEPIAGVVLLSSGLHYIVDLDALLDLEQERAFDAALAATRSIR